MSHLDGAEELELERIEIELLLEGIHRRYGFDFRQYAPASLSVHCATDQ